LWGLYDEKKEGRPRDCPIKGKKNVGRGEAAQKKKEKVQAFVGTLREHRG